MKVRIEERTVGELIDLKKNSILQVNHEYQRGLRWTDTQKCLFIDSIFRGYSIPAFYFHKKETSAGRITNTNYDIVDGQQRIDAIYSYSEDSFSLIDPSDDSKHRFPSFVKDDPCPWGGKRFSHLPENLKKQLEGHKVVVYEIDATNENSIRDLFIRLQGGTPLTPQDKRDSWPGKFTEFVLTVGGKSGVPKWYGFDLFKNLAKVSSESKRRQLVAQAFLLFWTVRHERKFCDIKSVNLDQFYHIQVGFDSDCDEAKRFKEICEKLADAMQGKPKVASHYIIHLILLTDILLDEYAPGWASDLASKLHEFDKRRLKANDDVKHGRETENKRYYSEYGQWIRMQTDNAGTIRRRHAFFVEEMLQLLSPQKLDPRRSFTNHERQIVFFRDQELCQWCQMNSTEHKVSWEECEVHHVAEHAAGGLTDIKNGALVHKDCHPKAREDVEKFMEYWGRKSNADSAEKQTTSV